MRFTTIRLFLRKIRDIYRRTRSRGFIHGWVCFKTAFINGFLRIANPITFFHRRRCPCCDWVGFDFYWLDCGSFTVPHVFCPQCGAQERHRFVHYFLQKEFGNNTKRENISVLHFAPEPHVYRYFNAEDNPKYVGADYAFHMINTLGFPAVQLDIQNLPFRDNIFDVIICFHVLEHVMDDHKGLEEINRVMSPKGVAVIMVPMMMGQSKTVEYGTPDPDMFDHVRGYSPHDFADRLDIFHSYREIHPKDILKEDQVTLHAIPNNSQIIYLCTKRQ